MKSAFIPAAITVVAVALLGDAALMGASYLKPAPAQVTAPINHPMPAAQPSNARESAMAADIHDMRTLADQKANADSQKLVAVDQARTMWQACIKLSDSFSGCEREGDALRDACNQLPTLTGQCQDDIDLIRRYYD